MIVSLPFISNTPPDFSFLYHTVFLEVVISLSVSAIFVWGDIKLFFNGFFI